MICGQTGWLEEHKGHDIDGIYNHGRIRAELNS